MQPPVPNSSFCSMTQLGLSVLLRWGDSPLEALGKSLSVYCHQFIQVHLSQERDNVEHTYHHLSIIAYMPFIDILIPAVCITYFNGLASMSLL